ncbi:hypothetical protein WP4W18E11_19340 [Acinetobacter baumannii]|nr:hypothetical protein WP4W18E11_19340 [Acinetobacter baumannii]
MEDIKNVTALEEQTIKRISNRIIPFLIIRRFKSQVQHICSQLKKLGVFIESLDFFNSQLESTQ